MRSFHLHAGRAWLLLAVLVVCAPAQATLRAVEIEGIEGELLENVQASLSINRFVGDEQVPDSHLGYLTEQATEEIRQALAPFGYYSVRIESDLLEASDGFVARYQIAPGEPTKVSDISITVEGAASDDPEIAQQIRQFPLSSGQQLRHRQYESGKSAIDRRLAERGYFDAERVRSQVRVTKASNQAVIDLHWNSGARYVYGQTNFEGSQLRTSLMQRFIPWEPGDGYRQKDLIELQRELIDSNYFAHVDITPRPQEGDAGVVEMDVSVIPRKRDRYAAGISIGTDSGLGVEGSVERRYVNDRGHQAKIEAGVAQRRTSFLTQYRVPVRRGDVQDYTGRIRYLDEETDSNDREIFEIAAIQRRKLGPWQMSSTLALRDEDFTIGDSVTGSSTLLLPSVALGRKQFDDPLYPRDAWSLEFYARGAAENVLSDTSFIQLGSQFRWIRGLGESNRLLTRVEVGTTAVDDFDQLPPSLRYFAGGDRSLRGYDFEELGPINAAGDVIGGEHLLVGSVEFEHMFTSTWGAAVFLDAGDAFSDFGEFEPEVGLGTGLRWRSPVGMVRVDIAAPVGGEGDSAVRLHLGIGPDL